MKDHPVQQQHLFANISPPKAPTSDTASPHDVSPVTPDLNNAELVQLHIRVIALENLLIALLANASRQQLDLALEMAAFISPRPSVTPHPLTIRAAAEMVHLVERASHFRSTLI